MIIKDIIRKNKRIVWYKRKDCVYIVEIENDNYYLKKEFQ